MTGVAKNTVVKSPGRAGRGLAPSTRTTALRGLTCRRVEADEIWAFCYAKEANVPEPTQGRVRVRRHLDLGGDGRRHQAQSSSWLVGERDTPTAIEFMQDVRERIANRTQLTTDGLVCYLTAVEEAFGSDVDYGQLVKVYGEQPESSGATARPDSSPPRSGPVSGSPDAATVTTSHIERQNLTMRMGMRRFTRLTNGFSKKAENLAAAVNLHYHALQLRTAPQEPC